jgi:uncharacterized protein YdhG (YjbR/CyaY superfamily)
MTDAAAVDAYLERQPGPQRAALSRLREELHRLAPDAVDAISYGIPCVKVDGRGLLWYAGWKAHCSIYPLTDAFLAEHEEELAGYGHGKGTLRFPPDAPLPDDLFEDLVRARLAEHGIQDLEGGVGGGVSP